MVLMFHPFIEYRTYLVIVVRLSAAVGKFAQHRNSVVSSKVYLSVIGDMVKPLEGPVLSSVEYVADLPLSLVVHPGLFPSSDVIW